MSRTRSSSPTRRGTVCGTSGERALTSFGDVRDTTAAVDADSDNLGSVDDPDLESQYAAEAKRMAEVHDPDDVI